MLCPTHRRLAVQVQGLELVPGCSDWGSCGSALGLPMPTPVWEGPHSTLRCGVQGARVSTGRAGCLCVPSSCT